MMDGNPAFGSSEAASQGGNARNKALSAPDRSRIARLAAESRWVKKGKKGTVKALREAPLVVGAVEFECAVLDDEKRTRVLSERAFSRAIGSKRGGSHWLRQKQDGAGAKLPVFLSANNLKPFISVDLAASLAAPIEYITSHGGKALGIRADLVPQILDVWLKARDAGKLNKPQQKFATIAELLMRGLATTGIVALIDEATGFEDERESGALAKILEHYITTELRRWMPTFPVSFFKELCRLKGIEFPKNMRLPRYFGHLVNDLVWERLAPGVLEKLKEKNPVMANGRRRYKNFQWITPNPGDPHLLHHLGMLEGLGRGFRDGDYDGFYACVDRAFQKWPRFPTLFDKRTDDTANSPKSLPD